LVEGLKLIREIETKKVASKQEQVTPEN